MQSLLLLVMLALLPMLMLVLALVLALALRWVQEMQVTATREGAADPPHQPALQWSWSLLQPQPPLLPGSLLV
jgi:hypothetical protein